MGLNLSKSVQNHPLFVLLFFCFGGSVRKCQKQFHGSELFPESACEGFFVKKHLQNYVSSTSSHLHLCASTFSPISLLIFTSTFTSAHLHLGSSSHPHIFTSTFTSAHLHLGSSSHPHIYISAHLHLHISTSLLMFTSAHLHLCSSSHLHILTSTSHICTSRSSLLSLLRRGAVPPEHHETQPSAEIVRVEGAKRRRDCDLARSGATLCGDRACRGREMQARARFDPVAGNPLRRSRASRARNAGESAIPAQPSAEIARVEGAKCCDLARTLCGDRAC